MYEEIKIENYPESPSPVRERHVLRVIAGSGFFIEGIYV
jgi:hypothetical protein